MFITAFLSDRDAFVYAEKCLLADARSVVAMDLRVLVQVAFLFFCDLTSECASGLKHKEILLKL